MVPKSRKSKRGSFETILFLEYSTHIVVIANKDRKGISGRIASINGRIFPVRFLYDLQKQFSLLDILSFEYDYLVRKKIYHFWMIKWKHCKRLQRKDLQ